MMIELNGAAIDVRDGATVRDAVAEAGVEGEAKGIAVALDGEVVPRGVWSHTALREGQAVEVLSAIQGG
jgi:sulfur carrier protein